MRILAAILLLWPSLAMAGMVQVRSADLGGVTRIVLQFETLTDWVAGRTARGYAVVLQDPAGTAFAQDLLFSAVRNGQVADIVADDASGRVDIVLECACWADVYPDGETVLVIDVKAGPPPADALFEAVLDTSPPAVMAEITTPGGFAVAIDTTLPPVVNVDKIAAWQPNRTPTGMPVAPIPDGAGTFSQPFPPLALQPSPLIEELSGLSVLHPESSFAVEMLSRELSRAVAQGLVDVPDLERDIPASSSTRSDPAGLGEGRSNISVSTAMDRDTGTSPMQPNPTILGSVCIPDSEVDLIAWGDPHDSHQLGVLRRQAFNSDATPSQKGALDLARYYLVMGFGAEAKAIAMLLDDPGQRALLGTLSDIVDNGESGSGLLDGQVSCKGKVALWSMLARKVPEGDKPSDTNNILSAFSELPEHIRIHLGPVLSERLRDLHYEEQAQIALNAVTRGGGHTRAQDLTAARLGLTGTTAEKARATLVELSRGTDLIAAEALLELLLDAERRDVAPDASWVTDAPSLVRATQGNETASELNLASLRGYIALGAFDDLRLALNTWSPGVTEDKRRDLANSAVVAAAETAVPAAFIRTEIAFSKVIDPQAMPVEGRVTVARRLVELGLPQRALPYVADVPGDPTETRVRAQALAALDRYGEAIDLLSGSDSADLMSELGDVLVKDRRLVEAVEVLSRSRKTAEASLAAMRGGDWDWISRNADDALSTASTALMDSGNGSDAGAEDNAGLLMNAAQRRARALELLDLTRVQDAAPFTN